MSIGENIKRIRKKQGLTQKELGERLGGISQQQIGQWETGKANPKIETIQKIAQALDVSLYELFIVKVDDTMNGIDLSLIDNPKDIEKYLFSIVPHLKEQAQREHEDIEKAEKLIESEQLENENIKILVDNYLKLNGLGQNKAIEQVELLTKIPEYKKVK